MNKGLAIGVLAYNEQKYLGNVLNDLVKLNKPIFIIDDYSTDDTNKIIQNFAKNNNITQINNKKNLGAGLSTKILIQKVQTEGYNFMVKIDGDGQFSINDVRKIIEIYENGDYKFIKSNRFWSEGIVGKIPKIRFFGNLLLPFLCKLLQEQLDYLIH